MNYVKPQLVLHGAAITAIQGGMLKDALAIEQPDSKSVDAYESDES